MNVQFAIYEALIQARVTPQAARGVVEALEKDMQSTLATKQDFEQLRKHIERMEQVFDLKLAALETRLVIKLSAVLVTLFGLLATVQGLLG